MRIAIFHNLRNGGGLHHINCIIRELHTNKVEVDVYTHQKCIIPYTNTTYYYPLGITSNIFNYVSQVLNESDLTEQEMAKTIIDRGYDYIFVFPCHIQQSPNILKYLPQKNTLYFFLESLREFYEKTSFNYYSIKQSISRLIRYPIKLQDRVNCKKAKTIIVNSYYSKNVLKKIYNKDSFVIYPGLIKTKLIKKHIDNNRHSYSFGLLTMLKGHHLSSIIDPYTNVFGGYAHEDISRYLNKETKLHKDIISDNNKAPLFSKFTFYLANQINEPFGLTTLEATKTNHFVIGRNEAGTSEIIDNGVNGYLYDTHNNKGKDLFNYVKNIKKISYHKSTNIDWKETVNKIMYIIKYV